MRKNLLIYGTLFQLICLCIIVVNGYSQALSSLKVIQNDTGFGEVRKEKLDLKKVLKDVEKEFMVFLNFDDKILENKYLNEVEVVEAFELRDVDKTLNHLLSPLSLTHEKIKDNIYLISETKMIQEEKAGGYIKPKSVHEGITQLASLRLNNFNSILINSKYEFTINGTVIDENGEGMPGVNVVAKGTTVGTSTDMNGSYSLTVPDGTTTLVFSFIGYVTQEVPINNRTTIDISLAPDVEALAEVVVIGYQTVRKQDLTGAVSVVDPRQATRVTTNSVAESLQGLTPGVTVRSGGQPGQMSRIEIRGAASFTNTDPLYVIDGMIADANTTINNNDIASIQILKDASAAAIYGSRAANGVVIITTKQGRQGPAKVSVSAKYGIQNIPKRWDLMNSTEFAAMQRTQYENSGQTPPASVTGNPTVNTDWQEEIIQPGNLQDYNLSLSGGSESSTYMISGSYFRNKGVLIGNSFQRGALRVNTKSTKGRVTFGENMVLSNSNGESIPATNVSDETNPFYNAPQMLPIIPVKDPSFISPTNPEGWGIGTNEMVTYATNPVAVANLSSRDYNFAKLVGNAYLDVKLTEWLSYRFNAGAEVSFDHTKDIREIGIWEFNAAPRSSSVDEERARFLSLLFENTLNFNKSFGRHNINGVIGISQQNTTRETTSGGRTNLQIYNNEYMTTIGSGSGISTAGGGRPIDFRIFGYLGRLNYNFNDRYLLTLTGRVDQDSRFGANYRTGFFPSIAAAWRISNEGFFNVDWVSDLKLHASYGELGIVTLGSWDYLGYINNSPRAVFGPDQTAFVGSTQARLYDPNLKWEERVMSNIGLDASFFDDKLTLTLEAYNSLSKDNLLALPVAGYLGNLQGDPLVNAGSIRNSGIEFSATVRNNDHDLKWEISGNFTTINNKVEDVGNRGEGINYIQVGNTRTQVGRSMGEWFLIQTDGLFQNQAEIDAHASTDGTVIQPNAKPGDIRFIDLNDDGTINAEDRTFVGSPWPKLQTGAQINASYMGLSLNFQLVGIFGYKIYNDVRRALDSYQQTNFRKDIDPWSTSNPGGEDPRIALNTEQSIIDNNRGDTERWLENGSYVRIRNLELGYAVPTTFLEGIGVETARLFISGQNLLTFTKYKGLDPDVVGNQDPNDNRARILERGVDLGNWPASRAFSIGINFGF